MQVPIRRPGLTRGGGYRRVAGSDPNATLVTSARIKGDATHNWLISASSASWVHCPQARPIRRYVRAQASSRSVTCTGQFWSAERTGRLINARSPAQLLAGGRRDSVTADRPLWLICAGLVHRLLVHPGHRGRPAIEHLAHLPSQCPGHVVELHRPSSVTVASTSRRLSAANRPGRCQSGYSSFRQLRGSAGWAFGVRSSRKLK
jgi:hypothetical protein